MFMGTILHSLSECAEVVLLTCCSLVGYCGKYSFDLDLKGASSLSRLFQSGPDSFVSVSICCCTRLLRILNGF